MLSKNKIKDIETDLEKSKKPQYKTLGGKHELTQFCTS